MFQLKGRLGHSEKRPFPSYSPLLSCPSPLTIANVIVATVLLDPSHHCLLAFQILPFTILQAHLKSSFSPNQLQ